MLDQIKRAEEAEKLRQKKEEEQKLKEEQLK